MIEIELSRTHFKEFTYRMPIQVLQDVQDNLIRRSVKFHPLPEDVIYAVASINSRLSESKNHTKLGEKFLEKYGDRISMDDLDLDHPRYKTKPKTRKPKVEWKEEPAFMSQLESI